MIRDILKHPTVANNPKICAIEKKFPHHTMLTGLVHDDRIVVVESMHRACALARMHQHNGDVVIALAAYDGDLPSIGKGDGVWIGSIEKNYNTHKYILLV